MSLKPFYLIGGAAIAIAAATAVTVFAADTPASKAPAAPPAVKAAPPAKGERKIIRMEGPSFAEIDANHDGSISQAEFDAFHAAHRPEGRGDGRGPEMRPGMMAIGRGFGGWGGPPPMMRMNRRFGGHDEGLGGMGGELHGERALDLLDTNSDGKLSFDELTAPLKRHFDRMDANHDGALSPDELKNGRGKSEGQMPLPPPAR
jgi:hypothetical protein